MGYYQLMKFNDFVTHTHTKQVVLILLHRGDDFQKKPKPLYYFNQTHTLQHCTEFMRLLNFEFHQENWHTDL